MSARNASACVISPEYRIFPTLQEDKSYSPRIEEISYNVQMRTQDDVRSFILQESRKAADSKGALAGWSRQIGRNHAYLFQFITKKSPRKLAENDRAKLAAAMEVPEAMLADSDSPFSLSQYGEGTSNHPQKVNSGSRNPPLQMIPGEQLMGEGDLPVYSTAQGGRQGALVLENEPFTYTSRPRRLIGRRDGYGVLVIGNSMAREYNEGDTAYVDPHLPPKKGHPCVFQGTREDGTVEAIIKYLERSPDASATLYYVSQTNPPKKFTIKKSDWQKCHVLVGKEAGN